MTKKVIPIDAEKRIVGDLSFSENESKDWVMARSMATLARSRPQKNLTTVEINSVTRQTKIAMVLLPEWGIYFPPYNVARLTSVMRAAGYGVTVFDVNVNAYNILKKTHDVDYWDPSREWMWASDTFDNEIFQHVQPIYQDYIEQIVKLNPDVVGFTLYYTNEKGCNWMAAELRKRLPKAKIIAGGPQALSPEKRTAATFHHLIQGEGEQLLLDFLEQIENNEPVREKFIKNPTGTRLNLDGLPFPDYTDYDFSLYSVPNGMSAEISRGCVAKCVFCTEVHFWKYRGRMSGNILDEIEYQHRTHDVDLVWFIDSLVNGNLKELRAFALGVVERGLKIRWQGYARCDGRMDLDYYKDLAASGCHYLNYGVETGSQRVLKDMKKNVTREEMESNFRSGHLTGIQASTNWIIGFPTEQPQDVADTFTLIWRIKNLSILNVSPGITMMLSPGSEVTMDPKKFNISDRDFMGAWCTEDLKNTRLHRLIRQKSFLIFLQNLYPKEKIWGVDRPDLEKLYKLNCNQLFFNEEIPYEEFDYNIIRTGISDFADSVVNETWPLFRTLWRAMGEYSIEVTYEPEADMREFGDRLACNYTAYHKFTITQDGKWQAYFTYDFNQSAEKPWVNYTREDLSFKFIYNESGNW